MKKRYVIAAFLVISLVLATAVSAFSLADFLRSIFGVTGQAVKDACTANEEGLQRCGGTTNRWIQTCKDLKWASTKHCTYGCSDEDGVACIDKVGDGLGCGSQYDVGKRQCGTGASENWAQRCSKGKDKDDSDGIVYGWVNKNYCQNGCLDGVCISKACDGGEQKCAGGFLKVCTKMGNWGAPVKCETGSCQGDDECLPASCVTIGETKCSAENPKWLLKCSNSKRWIKYKTCPGGCDASTNDCISNPASAASCAVGDLQCTGSWLQKCVKIDAASNGWLNHQYCANGCSLNQCNIKACTQGESKCIGATKLKKCEGGRFYNFECAPGKTCKEKLEGSITVTTCEDKACSVDELRCNPENPKHMQKCTANGKWAFFRNCVTGCDVDDTTGEVKCAGVISANCELGALRCGEDPWTSWAQRCISKAGTIGWLNDKYCEKGCLLTNGKPECAKA
jgi:hypothetical protein